MKSLKKELENCKNEAEKKKGNLMTLMQLPNLIDNKTPIGSSENDNKVINTMVKNQHCLILNQKNHLEIAEEFKFN